MTSTLSTNPTSSLAAGRRATWALWGTAAGAAGLVANMIAQPEVTDAQRNSGLAAFEVLTRVPYHVGAVAGFTAVLCLLVFAAGFRRWSETQASDSLALRVVPLALVASAGALTAAYGVKGQLASYLDGGFNEGSYPDEQLYTYFLLDDLAGFFSWWGVAIAMGAIAWIAFRERLVPRWVGAVAAIAFAVPVLFLLVFGFTGFSGVIGLPALVVVGIGLSRQRG